jgi:hypothetical protein
MLRLKRALDWVIWYVTNLIEAVWALWQAIRGREICGMYFDFDEDKWVTRYTADEREELRQSSIE